MMQRKSIQKAVDRGESLPNPNPNLKSSKDKKKEKEPQVYSKNYSNHII